VIVDGDDPTAPVWTIQWARADDVSHPHSLPVVSFDSPEDGAAGFKYNHSPVVCVDLFAEAGGAPSAAFLRETSVEVYNYKPAVATE
jgi:hypothetical protein